MVVGAKSFKEKVIRELNENPISFNKFKLKLRINDKYLGQTIESDLKASALATAKECAGKIKGAAIEMKQIIKDFQLQALGGLAAAWELWERAMIPSLLSGARTWLGDVRDTEKFCNSIQEFYWRTILEIPESCPKLALK